VASSYIILPEMHHVPLLGFSSIIYVIISSLDNRIPNFRPKALYSYSVAETTLRLLKIGKNGNLEKCLLDYPATQLLIQEEQYPQLRCSDNIENSHKEMKSNYIIQ